MEERIPLTDTSSLSPIFTPSPRTGGFSKTGPSIADPEAISLHVNSTISKDVTDGRKAKEDESLGALKTKRKGLKSRKKAPRIDSDSETWIKYEADNSTDSNEDDQHNRMIQPPIPNDEKILWREDALRRQAKDKELEELDDVSTKNTKNRHADHSTFEKFGNPSPKANLDDEKIGAESAQDCDSNEDANSEGSSKDPKDLATSLARRASSNLGLDLFENTDLSEFFGSLLDCIHRHSFQNDFLTQKIRRIEIERDELLSSRHVEDQDISNSAPDSSKEISEKVERHQVLHRIVCRHKNHRHGSSLFLDKPSRRGAELNGSQIVWDLTRYLFENSDIVFVLFQDYECEQAQGSQLEQGRFRKARSENVDSCEIVPDEESIYIISNALRSILIEVGNCSPFDRDNEVEMVAPYLYVYQHQTQLRKVAEERQGDLSLHIRTLLSYIENQHKEEYDDAKTTLERGVVTPEHLTKLYVPNQVLVSHRKGYHRAYVLESWADRYSFDRGRLKELKLRCWSWEYTGKDLKRVSHDERVACSQGEVAIDQLTVFPLRFASKNLQASLLERGQKFWSLRRQHLIAYSGLDFNKEKAYDRNRFMIDIATFSKMHKDARYSLPGQSNAEANRFDPWPQEISNEQDQLRQEDLIVLPPNISGFDFQEKEWVNLRVEPIEEITWNKSAFTRLVLPARTKELIQALVTARISGMQDIIANKGNGLVVLLHGGPGTGKTLTAESVAEMAEKPLYRVTCGDLGTDAVEVETCLTTIFQLGKIWDCVLLLDEADIFLEERSFADLQRNRIVSIFLRILEYYDGILVLTSNRVGAFDDAFRSRIQVSLHYSSLSRSARRQIWQNFLDVLDGLDDEVDMADLERHLDDLAQNEMNGRQIRNCVSTARALAAFKGRKLGWQHFEQAIRTTSEFQKYLKDVHEGLTEDEIAREDNLR